MSVIIGAILASFLLDEKLGRLGVCGCASCIVSFPIGSLRPLQPGVALRGADAVQIGSVVIVLHAPSDKEVETVDEILAYAAKLRESAPGSSSLPDC
jgi:hypothetical protein